MMRRNDREVTDIAKISDIISKCHCCRLGFYDAGKVYIVPLNFGYEETNGTWIFYFHGAAEGRKIDLIKQTHHAGFELDTNYKMNEADVPCRYSTRFQSVIGTGKITFIDNIDRKRYALQRIMSQNTGKKHWEFPTAMLNKTAVFELEVEVLSCKEHQ